MSRLLKTGDLVTPLISGTWPGSSTLWLQSNHLLEQEVLKWFLPIRYTTICCSHVECEHQLAPRTAINRHVREVKRGGIQPWTAAGTLYTVTEAVSTCLPCSLTAVRCYFISDHPSLLGHPGCSTTAVFTDQTWSRSGRCGLKKTRWDERGLYFVHCTTAVSVMYLSLNPYCTMHEYPQMESR